MRALGAGERALAMTVRRAKERVAFGKPLAEQGAVRERIAESRIALDQARALCHHAAYVIDSEGNKAARHLVAEAKVAVPRAVARGHRPGDPGARRARRHQRRPAGDDRGAGTGRCGSSTAPTRCTSRRWRAPSSPARRSSTSERRRRDRDPPLGRLDPRRPARRQGRTAVSLVVPARNEAATVGDVVTRVREALVDTVDAARRDRGHRLRLDRRDVRRRRRTPARSCTAPRRSGPTSAPVPGKGEAMWKSLFVTRGDVIVFMDADLARLGHPLRARPARPAADRTRRSSWSRGSTSGRWQRAAACRSRAAGSPSWSPGR